MTISNKKRNKKQENLSGWDAVLGDIEKDIEVLQEHRNIVKRKIEMGEPWPVSGNKVTKAGTDRESIPA